MSVQIQRRRGTTQQHETFTGAAGEITVDVSLNTARVHDGKTPGGFPLGVVMSTARAVLAMAALSLPAGMLVTAGADNLSYEVAPTTATDHHKVTAGGVKLYALPGENGYNVKAFDVSTAVGYKAMLDALPAGAQLHHPDDWSVDLDGSVEIAKKVKMTGAGEVRWTAGIENAGGFKVTADGCEFIGVRLNNPNMLQSDSGERNYGFDIRADEVLLLGNHIEQFQHPIAVRAMGEFHNFRILGNRLKDCIGIGLEDRADGIVVWGSQGVISGNVVNAKSGHDCRIGIHVESLPGSIVEDAPHNDALLTISNNEVYGKFRRSIVNEGCIGVAITGNTVADFTWQGIAIVENAKGTVASGNTVIVTRTAADTQGASYNPLYAGLFLYGTGEGNLIASNSVWHKPGSVTDCSIGIEGATSDRYQKNSAVRGNVITGEDDTAIIGAAVHIRGWVPEGITIADNQAEGALTRGVMIANFGTTTKVRAERNNFKCVPASTAGSQGVDWQETTGELVLRGNRIEGFYQGFDVTNAGAGEIVDNTILNCVVGILATNSAFRRIVGNYIDGVTHGIDIFGVTGTLVTCNDIRNYSGEAIRNVGSALVPYVYDNGAQTIRTRVTLSLATITNGASSTETVAVAGLTNPAHIKVFPASTSNGLGVSAAWLSGAGSVSFTVRNDSGADRAAASADFIVIAERYGALA
ncbi:NosD domain-containing protein [Celeribacter sp.]|uniref:NosD domain-containing protein n=1 Tax=Celeribacter sp. TaxID=1890673 RepID=UPI003A8F1029